MNYRHEFHAGNYSEVFKQRALLAHLLKKPKPFCVVDTHAESSLYQLDSVEAVRTGEANEGIKW